MTIHRYEVTDAEWAIIEPMLPKHHMGRPQKDLRAHFNGILWIARSGARWETRYLRVVQMQNLKS